MTRDDSQPDLADLFLRTSRTLRARWRESIAPLGITPHQSRVLAILGKADSAGLRNSQLAEKLHIAARSTTEVVDQLAQKDLVERLPDPADRRATLIRLTETGLNLLQDLSARRKAGMSAYFSKLNAEDQAELSRLLILLNGSA